MVLSCGRKHKFGKVLSSPPARPLIPPHEPAFAEVFRRTAVKRLKVTAPLPDHMRKSWELFGFDSEAESDPFPKARKR